MPNARRTPSATGRSHHRVWTRLLALRPRLTAGVLLSSDACPSIATSQSDYRASTDASCHSVDVEALTVSGP